MWGSIGVAENLIAASWDALVDSLEYGMQGEAPRRRAASVERGELRSATEPS